MRVIYVKLHRYKMVYSIARYKGEVCSTLLLNDWGTSEIDPAVKAIVSSGYSNDPIMTNFREYGFCGFIAKPYKIRELSAILHKVIAEMRE